MVSLTATGPEVYVATITTIISYSCYSLVDTLNHMNNIKLKDLLGRYAADFYNAILVNVDILEIAGAFKLEYLGYIIRIFEDTYDYIFRLWATQKYKEVMDFVKEVFIV